MPHRTLSVKEVAQYLHLASSDIEALLKERAIPCERQGERVVFRLTEIEAWASQRILNLPSKGLAAYHGKTSTKVREFSPDAALMPQLLTVDRINAEMLSKTRASVIRDMVDLAEKTDLLSDRADLIRMIEEREQLCSTALPGGLALMHPRNHDPYMFTESFMILGRTVQPIHFGAQDGSPTDLFFLVCCQDDRIHLHCLARLCTLCQETTLLGDLRNAESSLAMLDAIVTAEEPIIRRL